jgi:hypothetical protein
MGRDKDSERTTSFITFVDPNLFGTRWQMRASYKDKDDGDGQSLSFIKPFYSLDTRTSYRFAVKQDERTDSLYFRNVAIEKFTHQEETADISLGFSDGLVGQQAFRWKIGLHFDDHLFGANAQTNNVNGIPDDRNRSYVWVGFEQIENNYQESKNSDQIGQTEDIFLGRRINARVGYGVSPSGDKWPFWHLSAEFQDTYQPTTNTLANTKAKGSGNWNTDRGIWENMQLELASRIQLNPFTESQWLFSGKIKYSKNLTRDNQLLLGGDNGLRGYPARYQLGDRSYLLTLEKRYFLDWQLWDIFHFGIAAFVDVGRAWFPNQDNGINGGTLSDFGVGLRISSSRFEIDRVLHIDIAYPLDREDPEIESLQLLISGKTRF